MTITSLNSGKNYAVQLSPRELAIIITTLDGVITGVEASGVVPEALVPQSAKNKPDPAEAEILRDVADAKRLQLQFVAVLPDWREL